MSLIANLKQFFPLDTSNIHFNQKIIKIHNANEDSDQ